MITCTSTDKELTSEERIERLEEKIQLLENRVKETDIWVFILTIFLMVVSLAFAVYKA